MHEIDFEDTKAIWNFAQETVTLAEVYQTARKEFAESVKELKILLAKAYANDSIKESISEDKAFIKLASTDEMAKTFLNQMLDSEQEYKGLEKVLDARQALISLSQSFIKNKP